MTYRFYKICDHDWQRGLSLSTLLCMYVTDIEIQNIHLLQRRFSCYLLSVALMFTGTMAVSQYSSKRKVFNCDLKVSRFSANLQQFRKLFHNFGPCTQNARSAKRLYLVKGTFSIQSLSWDLKPGLATEAVFIKSRTCRYWGANPWIRLKTTVIPRMYRHALRLIYKRTKR